MSLLERIGVDAAFWQRVGMIYLFSIVVAIIAISITYVVNPSIDTLPTAGTSIERAEGFTKALAYIGNNGFVVPFQMFLLALLPIPFVYLLNILSSAIAFGVVVGFALRLANHEAYAVIFASIPHFLTEFLGFALFASMLYLVNRSVRDHLIHIFKKSRDISIPFFPTLRQTGLVYIVLALPVIVLAAFLETYIADSLFHLLK